MQDYVILRKIMEAYVIFKGNKFIFSGEHYKFKPKYIFPLPNKGMVAQALFKGTLQHKRILILNHILAYTDH